MGIIVSNSLNENNYHYLFLYEESCLPLMRGNPLFVSPDGSCGCVYERIFPGSCLQRGFACFCDPERTCVWQMAGIVYRFVYAGPVQTVPSPGMSGKQPLRLRGRCRKNRVLPCPVRGQGVQRDGKAFRRCERQEKPNGATAQWRLASGIDRPVRSIFHRWLSIRCIAWLFQRPGRQWNSCRLFLPARQALPFLFPILRFPGFRFDDSVDDGPDAKEQSVFFPVPFFPDPVQLP